MSVERRLVAVLCVSTFAAIYSQSVIVPLVTQIAAEFAVSVGTVGVIVTAYAVPGIVAGAAAGPFSDRYGRRGPLIVGTVVLGVCTIASAFAADLPTLAALRAAAGLGASLVLPNMMAAVGDHFDGRRRASVISTVFMANTLGSLAGVGIAGLLADAYGWRVSLGVSGVIGLAAAAGIVMTTFRRVAAPRAALLAAYGIVLRDRSATALLLSNLLGVVAWGTWFTFIVVFFERHFGLSHAVAATYALVQSGGMLVGSQFGARLGTRYGQRLVLAFSLTGFGLLLLPVTMLTLSLPVTVTLCALGAVLFGLRATSNAALYIEQVPSARSTMLGLSATTVAAASAISGISGGLVLDTLGFGGVALYCLVAALASGAVVLALVSESAAPPASSALPEDTPTAA